MKLKGYLFLLASIISLYAQALVNILQDSDLNGFSVIDGNVQHDGADAYIRIVTDGAQRFILKQICIESLDEQFLLINDALASTIGCKAGVPVNTVSFIPYTVASHLKKYPHRAATLHSCIPGQDLEHYNTFVPDNFNLQQRVISSSSPWQIEYPVAENSQGLTQKIIESMAIHDDLPPIAALDTFIGNSDRSLPNIFYDSKDDHFYGIDQAAAFCKNLPKHALKRLKQLFDEKYFNSIDLKITQSLILYKKSLSALLGSIEPQALILEMAQLAAYLGENSLQDSLIQERLPFHYKVFSDNYSDVLELVEYLTILCDEKQLG